MKKILSLLMALTILLACFGMSAEVPVVTVNSWSWVDSGWADCLNAVFGNFAETHQDVVIDLDTYSCAYADVMNNLLVQAPTQTTPDIAMVKAAWLPQLLDLGVLADISTALPAEALHCNTSYLTAVANDYSYDVIYSRLIKGIGNKGDVLIGLSTSGNSRNIYTKSINLNKIKVKNSCISN